MAYRGCNILQEHHMSPNRSYSLHRTQQNFMTLKKFNVQKYKITIPISNILIIWTPIFEWFMVRSVSKNGHQKDRCREEIGLHAMYMLITPYTRINMIGDTHMTT